MLGLVVAIICLTSERGAIVPYVRYEADDAIHTGTVMRAADFNQSLTASEASKQTFVSLEVGGQVEWKLHSGGAGVTLRYTIENTDNGLGANEATFQVIASDKPVADITLTSYWSWVYFNTSGNVHFPQNAPVSAKDGKIRMRFDEMHFKLPLEVLPNTSLKLLFINSTNSVPVGIDFIEIEDVPEPIPQPRGFLSIASYPGSPLEQLIAALKDGKAQRRGVYIPPGNYSVNKSLSFTTDMVAPHLQGAGFWHTNLYFSNPGQGGGGIKLNQLDNSIEISHFYMNTANNKRMVEDADGRVVMPKQGKPAYINYHGLKGSFNTGSKIHHMWIEHFEVGGWIGFEGSPALPSEHLEISFVRIRNMYAGGINLNQGASHSIIQNCSVRSTGDDGLVVFSSQGGHAVPAVGNTFRYNTIEHVWRAGGIAFFGGTGHQAHNNLVRDGCGSSGIRMSNIFPSYPFFNNGTITVRDCDLDSVGTSFDLWDGKHAAIDLSAHSKDSKPSIITNVNFQSISIKNSQRDAIQMASGSFMNVTFSNISACGIGRDTQPTGAMLYSTKVTGPVLFKNMKATDYKSKQPVEGGPPPSFTQKQVTWGTGDPDKELCQ